MGVPPLPGSTGLLDVPDAAGFGPALSARSKGQVAGLEDMLCILRLN